MPVAFSDRTDHTLDSAVEAQELTADVPAFLRACASGDPEIERLVALPKSQRVDRRKNESDNQWLCRKIIERTDTLVEKLAPEQDPRLMQDIWLIGMFRAAAQARSVARHLAYCSALELTSWGDHRPYKTWERRAHSLRHQRQWLWKNDLSRHFIPLLQRVVDLGHQFKPTNDRFEATQGYRFDYLMRRMEYYGALTRPDDRRVSTRRAGPSHEERVAVRRAISLARTIVGEHALHSFLKGATVHVLGSDFGFAVKKQSIFRLGHGAISITLCDHALQPLADLCVYFDKTPAIDQLVALRLHCDAGMDTDILYDANVMREYPAAAAHPGYQTVRQVKEEDAKIRTAIIRTLPREQRSFETMINALGAGEITTNVLNTSSMQPRWVTVSAVQTSGVVIDGTTRSNFLLRSFGGHHFQVAGNTSSCIRPTSITPGALTVNNPEGLRIERLDDGQLRIFLPGVVGTESTEIPVMRHDLQFRDRKTGKRYYGNLAYEEWSEDWHRTSGLSETFELRIAEALRISAKGRRSVFHLINSVTGDDGPLEEGPAAAPAQTDFARADAMNALRRPL